MNSKSSIAMSGHFAAVPLVSSAVEVREDVQPQSEEKRPVCTVGNTGLLACGYSAVGRQVNVESLVLTITRLSCRGMEASASTVQLVESLVWPFVARRSCRKEIFSDKEFHRMVASMRITATRILRFTNDENFEQTYMKYWLDTALCQVFLDAQRPDPITEEAMKVPLFSGWLKRFVARAVARRDISFIYSIQKGSKRFWPRLGEIKEKKALQKHAERLSQMKGTINSQLSLSIERTSRRIFSRAVGSVPTKFMPSGSACLQASRREGGALNLVSRYTMPLNSEASKKIGKLPTLNATINDWRNANFDLVYSEAVKRTTYLVDDHFPALDVNVIAIPEPGKFRIISLGDGYLYSALQPLQGLMLDAWKHSPYATMRDQDLTERVEKIDTQAKLPFWCSVDYEAATDLLKRDATLKAFAGCRDLPLYDLGWMSLLVGRAVYPDGTEIDALEGQLMGHPLSFPLLCVINLAVYFQAILAWIEDARAISWPEHARRSAVAAVMRKNVLVNGDDMLFKCEEAFYPIFKRTAADAGFKISAGKNYLSPDACMINSQTFRRVHGHMKRFGYLNMKIVKGFSLKTGDSAAVPTQIGKDLAKMAKLCPWTASCIPAALNKWKADWFGKFYKPNWYLPVHLGGFGVDRDLAPKGWRITRSQRLMAARFVNDPRMALYRREGMDLPTAELAGALAHWRMIPGPYVPRESEVSDPNEEWLGRLAYACRAHHGSKPVTDAVMVSRFKPEYRLKPMSAERLELYWDAQLFASRLPLCPPIGLLRPLSFDSALDRPSIRSSSVTSEDMRDIL